MKRVASFALALLILMCSTIGIASADMVISNDNENTNLEFRDPGYVYVEFVQNGSSFPINTGSGFIVSTVTAEDADGNVLGNVYATDGVLDYSMYLGQAVRLHIVNSYTDEYLILPDVSGEAAPSEPSEPSEPSDSPVPSAPANPQPPASTKITWNSILTTFGCIILVVMVAIILTASITCIRERRKAK